MANFIIAFLSKWIHFSLSLETRQLDAASLLFLDERNLKNDVIIGLDCGDASTTILSMN